MARKPALFQAVLRKLKADLPAFAGSDLPPLAALARRYGAGLSTLQKAARFLEREGILFARPGRPFSLRPPSVTPALPVSPALAPRNPPAKTAALLEEELRKGLQGGRWRSGQPLPKVGYFSRQFRASHHTVTRVLRHLEESGLVHRKGRAWWAGRETASARGASPSFILVVEPDIYSWEKLHTERTGPFITEFEREAQRCQVTLGFLPQQGNPGFYGLLEAGNAKLLRLRKEGRVLGVLFCRPPAEFSDFRGWARRFSSWGLPVLYFDLRDDSTDFEEKAGRGPKERSPLRLCSREADAVETALAHLADHGHRRIAFCSLQQAAWVSHRLERAGRQGRRRGLEVLDFSDPDKPLQDAMKTPEGRRRLAEGLRALPACEECRPSALAPFEEWVRGREAGAPEDGAFRARARAALSQAGLLPGLLPLFEAIFRSGATAILASNDWSGRKLFTWLHLREIPIPGRISLLSFDNHPSRYGHPLSSVDFGFANLAYQAFHRLRADGPGPGRGISRVTALPEVMDRGSVGPPFAGSLP